MEVSEGTDDAPARLIERKRRTALPGALGALLPRSGAVLPRVRDALTMFVVIVLCDAPPWSVLIDAGLSCPSVIDHNHDDRGVRVVRCG